MHQRTALIAVAAALSLGPASRAQAPVDVDHIANWPAPLFWQPAVHNTERANFRGRFQEQVIRPDAASLGKPATFVAMSPCRVVDTRFSTFPAGFGPPSFAAEQTRVIAVPSGPCSVPHNAVAYSLNIAVLPIPPGNPMRWLTAWDDGSPQPLASTLNDKAGLITSNSAVVPAGNAGAIDIFTKDPTDVIVDINGYYLPAADASANTIVGLGALASFSGGTGSNTAVGASALNADTTGPDNTAVGSNALLSNTTGSTNTAIGSAALPHNTTGNANTAIGVGALSKNTSGNSNTAIGDSALSQNTSGNGNTAIGYNALVSTTGSNNFAIGNNAGTGANGNWNVFIANQGVAGDTNLIRIGDANQTKIFMSGISGVTTGGAAVPVVVDGNGQLGTASSSRSTKQDIEDMGDTTSTLMSLHPVRFHYKAWGADSAMQYGLIAEDVAGVAPDLVARTPKGEIMTVFYDKVNAMVLNQVQEQQRLIDKQSTLIQQLESRIADLENRAK
jgi:hypothetical protein